MAIDKYNPPLEGEFLSKDDPDGYFRTNHSPEWDPFVYKPSAQPKEPEKELKDDFWVALFMFSFIGMGWFFISCLPEQ